MPARAPTVVLTRVLVVEAALPTSVAAVEQETFVLSVSAEASTPWEDPADRAW